MPPSGLGTGMVWPHWPVLSASGSGSRMAPGRHQPTEKTASSLRETHPPRWGAKPPISSDGFPEEAVWTSKIGF